MTTPRMSSVFLVEATEHAWRNLGYTPEARSYIEETAPAHPYELAIIIAAMADSRAQVSDPKRLARVLGHVVFNYLPALRRSVKLRADLRRESAQLVSSRSPDGYADGLEKIYDIIARYPIEEPEDYEGEPLVELDGGWRWVSVSDQSCRDYEGRLMQHCGGAYHDMVSLRDPQGKPHATVEVSGGPNVVQVKGKQNAKLDKKYWPQLAALFDHLSRDGKVMFKDEMYLQPDGPIGDLSWRDRAVEFLEFLKMAGVDSVLDVATGRPVKLADPELTQKLLRVPYERTPEDGAPPAGP